MSLSALSSVQSMAGTLLATRSWRELLDSFSCCWSWCSAILDILVAIIVDSAHTFSFACQWSHWSWYYPKAIVPPTTATAMTPLWSSWWVVASVGALAVFDVVEPEVDATSASSHVDGAISTKIWSVVAFTLANVNTKLSWSTRRWAEVRNERDKRGIPLVLTPDRLSNTSRMVLELLWMFSPRGL